MDARSRLSEVYFIAAIVVSFCIPTTIRWSSLSIIALAVAWVGANSFTEKIQNLKQNKVLLLAVAAYCAVLTAGLLNTENIDNGLKLLEKNSGLISLTLLLATGPVIRGKWFDWVLMAFLAGCVIVLTVDLGYAARNYSITKSLDEFFYWQLTDYGSEDNIFHHNPIYLATHFVFGIIICVYLLQRPGITRPRIIGLAAVGIVLLTGVLLLSSKTAFGILVAYVAYMWISVIKGYSFRTRAIIIVFSAALIIAFMAVFGSTLINRYKEIANPTNFTILQEDRMNDFSRMNGLTIRLMFWKFGITESIAMPYWFFGQGTGDVQNFLNKVYEKHNMAITLSDTEIYGYYEYNSHNQYVESFLRNGIPGVIALLLFFGVAIVKAIREKSRLMIWLMLTVMLICLTESFMEANKGIIFTTFFIVLFYRSEDRRSTE